MKLKFTKHFKILLVFIVILISFIYARYGTRFVKQTEIPVDIQRISRDFRQAKNQTKHEIQFNVDDINEFINYLELLESSLENNINILRKNSTSNSFVYLAEIKSSHFQNAITHIKAFETIDSKKEQSFKSQDLNVNLNERLEINEALKKRYLFELEKSKQTLVSNRLQNQLNSVQSSIDSLNIAIKEQEYNKNNGLLYLTIGKTISGTKNLLSFTGGFASRFIIGFIALTVGLFIVLFLFNIVLRFMSVIGIQTASGKGGGGKYGSSKYSSYKYGGSGYGSSKRKVKRIYKDKDDEKSKDSSDKK